MQRALMPPACGEVQVPSAACDDFRYAMALSRVAFSFAGAGPIASAAETGAKKHRPTISESSLSMDHMPGGRDERHQFRAAERTPVQAACFVPGWISRSGLTLVSTR